AAVDAAFATLRAALPSMIRMLRAGAPAATIVLVTYARLVPPTPCPALAYSQQGFALVGSIGTRLEQTFLDVVQQTGVRLADPYVLGADHGPCAPAAARWVDGHSAPAAYPYHPTALGHEEMASLVQAALSK
ncbi:MAG: hypothetical protein JOZ99_04160, partial [Actinobacteria bacterium]|nr:hypothetical protein [Actinomycetota bacterium]